MSSFWKGLILRDTEKEIYFPSGFEPSIHGLRGELSTADELLNLLMNRHKVAYVQCQISLFTNQSSVRQCHKNDKLRTKCSVSIAKT